jgi:hypothetical protein
MAPTEANMWYVCAFIAHMVLFFFDSANVAFMKDYV